MSKEITMDQIKEMVIENQAEKVELEGFNDSTSLEEVGIDSLGMVSIAFALEDLTEVTIEDDAIETIKTLGDLRQYLAGNDVTITA